MATKSYTKHKEFKEFSSKSSNKAYGSDEQFDIIKNELLPKNSKLRSLTPTGGSDSDYHYEYHEEKHPSGKYERKDLHTVEQYTIPPKSDSEHSSYYYTREEKSLPTISTRNYETNSTRNYETNTTRNYEENLTSSSPGYSRIKSSKKETSHNVEELDSLLDDLQRDQERQVYKSGYTSDAAESSTYDYRKTTSTPIKTSAPSSGYSTLKTERSENWQSSPLRSSPLPVKQEFKKKEVEMFREEKTESHVVPSQISPAIAHPVPAPICHQCQFPSTTVGPGMNKVTTTVKTYTYEVPADQPVSEVTSRYLSSDARLDSSTTTMPLPVASSCQYCSHCHSRITQHDSSVTHVTPPPPITASMRQEHREHRMESTHTEAYPRSERVVFPKPANDVRTPVNFTDAPALPSNGPGGPTTYKWSETSYSAYNTTERRPLDEPAPPFPRPVTPAPADQQPPKKLDDLLAEFPDTRFPTQPDGVHHRKVEIMHESKRETQQASKNMAGPAVYYPPGHKPFEKKETAYSYGQASAEGGKWAAGRGMYEYEAGSKSKEKSSETKKVVPVCLPLCCAMPCSIM